MEESESESEYFIYLRGEIVSLQVLLVSIGVKNKVYIRVCTDVVDVTRESDEVRRRAAAE